MPTLPEQVLATESRQRRTLQLPPFGLPTARREAGLGLMAGCLPMALGVGIWLLFWFADAEPPTGMRKWGSALFAAVFFSFGLVFFLQAFWPPRFLLRWRLQGGREPWGEGYPWRREMAPYVGAAGGGVKSVVGFVALALFGVAINLPLADMENVSGDAWLAWVIIPFFDLLILLVLGAAVWEVVKRLRFGRARLALDTFPASPGGTLRASFHSARRVPLDGPPTVRLRCVEQTTRRSERPGRLEVRVAVEAIYTQERALPDAPAAGRLAQLEIALPVPADLPSTCLRGAEERRVYWLLEVELPIKGPNVAWQFLVPVYASGAAATD